MSGQRGSSRDITRINRELDRELDTLTKSFLEKFNDQMEFREGFLRMCREKTGMSLPDFIWSLLKPLSKGSKADKMFVLNFLRQVLKENAELYQKSVPRKSFSMQMAGKPEEFRRAMMKMTPAELREKIKEVEEELSQDRGKG